MPVMEGIEFYLSKTVGRAIIDYKMIEPGDKVAVAVSGGKDSLALLKILLDRQKFVPIKYDLLALHVDLGYPRSLSAKLEKYFRKIKVKYRIVKSDDLKSTPKKEINCFWCSWNRRKHLFQTADRLGCNKIALGHHKDDIVETILMNLFFQGEISAMKPRQELFKGKIKIIRPLAYAEEDMIRKFAREKDLPHDTCICPNSTVSQRAAVGKIIAGLRKTCPEVKTNIFKSAHKERIKQDYLL